jgi:hypothetical protein
MNIYGNVLGRHQILSCNLKTCESILRMKISKLCLLFATVALLTESAMMFMFLKRSPLLFP